MGIYVTTVDFGKIKIASGLESRLVELWTSQHQEEIAKSQGRIEVTHGEAQAGALEVLRIRAPVLRGR